MQEYFCKTCGTVFQTSSQNPRCCKGDVEQFSIEKHRDSIISSSNSWVSVWKRWKDNPIFEEISQELSNNGSYGAATHINEFIQRLLLLGKGE